jgi:hypothetical protein
MSGEEEGTITTGDTTPPKPHIGTILYASVIVK